LNSGGNAWSINADPVSGPPDRLEHAIATGTVWDDASDPVTIDWFDARKHVLSVIFDQMEDALELDIRTADTTTSWELLANGKPMAKIGHSPTGFSLKNVRVLQSRNAQSTRSPSRIHLNS
jgi:hypothetical protein